MKIHYMILLWLFAVLHGKRAKMKGSMIAIHHSLEFMGSGSDTALVGEAYEEVPSPVKR